MTVVAVVVAMMFLAGVALALHTRSFVRRAVRVRARIVDRDWNRSRSLGPFQPKATRYTVEFKDSNGRVQRVPLRTGIGESIHETLAAGDGLLPILYDPRNPAAAQVDAAGPLYVVPVYLCAPAVLLLVFIAYVRFAY